MEIRTRFAPSPTGDLHIGGARTALFNYLFAKSMKGKFLLRIEDTDLKRSKSSLTEKIINDIKWLNIPWDEEIVFQRQNQNKHKQIIDYLLKKGLAFRCFSEKENHTGSNFEKSGAREAAFRSPWRDLSKNTQPDKQYVVRFKVPSEPSRITFTDKVRGELSWDLSKIEDFVIARSDGSSTYNLAVVVDDHNMKISHVIRGEDHLTNTVKQLLIYHALNWVTPEFAHIPLIHNAKGEKLSKRDGTSSLLDFKQEGFLPDAMLNYLARLGWSYKDKEFFNLNQAISWFSLDGIGKSPSRFDIKKLLNISKKHLISKPEDEIHKSLLRYIKIYKDIDLSETISEKLRQYLPLIIERCNSLGEIFDASSFLFEADEVRDKKSLALLDDNSRKILSDFIYAIKSANFDWNSELLKEFINTYCKEGNLKFRDIGIPLRIALTGSTSSPSIVDIMEILGEHRTLDRLNNNVE